MRLGLRPLLVLWRVLRAVLIVLVVYLGIIGLVRAVVGHFESQPTPLQAAVKERGEQGTGAIRVQLVLPPGVQGHPEGWVELRPRMPRVEPRYVNDASVLGDLTASADGVVIPDVPLGLRFECLVVLNSRRLPSMEIVGPTRIGETVLVDYDASPPDGDTYLTGRLVTPDGRLLTHCKMGITIKSVSHHSWLSSRTDGEGWFAFLSRAAERARLTVHGPQDLVAGFGVLDLQREVHDLGDVEVAPAR